MGQQVECRVEFNGEVSSGKAMLESDAIHFRGGFRLNVPLKDLKGVSAAGGRLSLTFGGGTAVFDLGERAQKWLAKIKNPKGLLEKLGVSSSHSKAADARPTAASRRKERPND
ncbi:MAG: hypothetical protein ACJ74Q_13995 [Pyrinomonadaceae bacterium]